VGSEFSLIEKYFRTAPRKAALGVGDDCALLYAKPGVQLAVSTDVLNEGTHFTAGADPRKLGHKALAVNLSDLAAMGADPAYALLALSLPLADEAWVAAFADGFFGLARQYGVDLVGGDTTRGPLSICVTVLGEVPSGLALRRDGAQPGDDLWVSGATGEAALGLEIVQGRLRLPDAAAQTCIARLDTPAPRVELGGRLRGVAHSAIDISDGLLADVGHVARASGVAIRVEANALPVTGALAACEDPQLRLACMVGGGDDYELAFTAPADRRDEVLLIAAELSLPVHRIGAVMRGEAEAVLVDRHGGRVSVPRRGYDHFAATP
jgi:thiamine-monophosphate kinase